MNNIEGNKLRAFDYPNYISSPLVADINIMSVFERVISSHLSHCLAVSAMICVGAALTVGAPGLLAAGAVTVTALALGVFFNKHLKYEVSIINTALQKSTNTLGSKILPNLILGPGPLKNKGDHLKILKADVSLVVTLLERFEWESPSWFSEPMTLADWAVLNIRHLGKIRQEVLETADFAGVPLDIIKKGVELLHQEIDINRGTVYLHCKAGRGRSATIAICYLLKYGYLHGVNELVTVDDAIAHVKSKRDQININSNQRAAILAFYKDMNKSNV